MSTTSQQYDQIISICRNLYKNKLHDYGCAWRVLRLPSLTDQIYIKAARIRSLQENIEKKIDEDETSEFIGIINFLNLFVLHTVAASKGKRKQEIILG